MSSRVAPPQLSRWSTCMPAQMTRRWSLEIAAQLQPFAAHVGLRGECGVAFLRHIEGHESGCLYALTERREAIEARSRDEPPGASETRLTIVDPCVAAEPVALHIHDELRCPFSIRRRLQNALRGDAGHVI